MIYFESYYGVAGLGEPYLMHHGIKGMKWGVRRYQNKDGTLKATGKRHRQDTSAFKVAEKAVLKKVSNNYGPISKQPIDLLKVKERGKLNTDEAKACSELANKVYDKTAEVEPKITKDVILAVSTTGSSMYGLENRLKQPTSLAAKIGSDAKESGKSFAASANSISDVIRYTSVTDDSKFVSSYMETKRSLSKAGYEEIKCKNYFDSYAKGLVKHKAVQCVYKDKSGNKFELQYQTPSSQAAKELKVPIYEERRKSGLSEARKIELERQMTDLAEHVKNPRNVMSIKSH